MLKFDKKIIISGNIVEVFEYEKMIIRDRKSKKVESLGRAIEAPTNEAKEKNRALVQKRARSTLRRLVSANVGQYLSNINGKPYSPKFFTLTFAENVQDIPKANYEFKKFRQRLETYLGYKAKYVVVIEFQKRGAIHYHMINFNMPFIQNKKLAEIWNQGFVRVNAIDEVDNVGAYVCKYMGKDLQDDRLRGQKCYFSSRGLFKPLEITKKEEIENLVGSLPLQVKTYEFSFENEYLGTTHYTQYNTKKELSYQKKSS